MTPSQHDRVSRALRDGAAAVTAAAREVAGWDDAFGAARRLLDAGEPGRREIGARAMGEIAARGGPEADAAVAALAGVLRFDEDHAVLCAALEALGGLADASGAGPALVPLAGHRSFSVRWRAAAALRAAHGDDPAVDAALVALAADPRPIVRLEAVDAIGLLPPPRPPALDEALRAACDDPDDRTAASAIVGLARAGAPLPAEPLARALAPDRMARVSSSAAERLLRALAGAGRPEAHPPLRHLALLWRPHDPAVARALGAAVAASEPVPAVPALG